MYDVSTTFLLTSFYYFSKAGTRTVPSPLEDERLRIVIVERTRKQSVLETKQVMTLVMFSSKK